MHSKMELLKRWQIEKKIYKCWQIIKNQTRLKLKNLKIIKFIKSSSFNVYSTHLPISHSQVSFTQIILNTYPLSTRFHTFRVKLNRHAYLTHKLVYGPVYRHSPIYQIQSTHTPICVKLNRHIYLKYQLVYGPIYRLQPINIPPKY